jgi:hypothetical protein
MPRDMMQRVTLARTDNCRLRSAVSAARSFIYEKHHGINGAAVEGLLQGMSLVPTVVRGIH